MLDILRQGAQSWGIKVLFGIIIAVFVLAFGMDRSGNDARTVVATVNDAPILLKHFHESVQRNTERARSQNPGLTAEFLAQIRFKEQILNDMITQELLRQKALEWGVVVSNEELAREIHLIPAFQNEADTFDPQKYTTVLNANHLTPGQFESEYAQGLLMDKVRSYIALPGRVSDEQAKDLYDYGRSTTSLSTITYPWEHFSAAGNATDEQIEAYYSAHKDQFAVPAKAKVAYLVLSPETLATPGAISTAEARDYYTQHKDRFAIEEQVNARHILIRVESEAKKEAVEDAEKKIKTAQKELAAGVPFAEVAAKYTEDPSGMANGGSLGWFGRGRMVKEFEDAAFSTPKGSVSEPVRSSFGFHLIFVEDHKDAGFRPFEDVASAIQRTLAQDQAAETLHDQLDHALELLLTGSNLAAIASQIGKSTAVQTTDFFDKNNGPAELAGLSAESKTTLFDLPVNASTETPLLLDEGYVLATKLENTPATTTPLDEVRPAITAAVLREEALQLAKAAADADLKALINTGLLANGDTPAPIETPSFTRQGDIPGLGQSTELATAAFSTQAGNWLAVSYRIDNGYVIAKANGVTPPSVEDWEKNKELWIMSLNQRAEDQAVQAFLTDLRAQAEVRILNPAALEN